MISRTFLALAERSSKGLLSLKSSKRTGHLGAVQLGGGVAFHPELADSQAKGNPATSPVTETIFDGEDENGGVDLEASHELGHDVFQALGVEKPSPPPSREHAAVPRVPTPVDVEAKSNRAVMGKQNVPLAGNPLHETDTSPEIDSGANAAEASSSPVTHSGSTGNEKSVDAYRFLLHHIDAEIAALRRRHSSVSSSRTQLEEQQTSRIRELYHLMDNPWLLLQTAMPPALPATGIEVYMKEQLQTKRIESPSTSLDLSRDKMLLLAFQRNYLTLSFSDKRPYEEAARYNAALRQEMKRRLSSGCSRFEAFCEGIHEATAEMAREGRLPASPAGAAAPAPSVSLSFPPRAAISRGMPRPAAAADGASSEAAVKGARVMSRGRVRVQHRPLAGVPQTPVASPTAGNLEQNSVTSTPLATRAVTGSARRAIQLAAKNSKSRSPLAPIAKSYANTAPSSTRKSGGASLKTRKRQKPSRSTSKTNSSRATRVAKTRKKAGKKSASKPVKNRATRGKGSLSPAQVAQRVVAGKLLKARQTRNRLPAFADRSPSIPLPQVEQRVLMRKPIKSKNRSNKRLLTPRSKKLRTRRHK